MIKELYEVLKALVDDDTKEAPFYANEYGIYCVYCSSERTDEHPHEYPHKPDCPITKGRELVKQMEAMTPSGLLEVKLSPDDLAAIKRTFKEEFIKTLEDFAKD